MPEYLDWFVYMKHLNYSKEYIEQANIYKKDTIVLNTPIKYSNVFNNYSNIDLDEVYADYNYQPLKMYSIAKNFKKYKNKYDF